MCRSTKRGFMICIIYLSLLFKKIQGLYCEYDDIELGCLRICKEKILSKIIVDETRFFYKSDYPYMVSLQKRMTTRNTSMEESYYEHFCGATMISSNLALTSAYCILKAGFVNMDTLQDKHISTVESSYYAAIRPQCRHFENPDFGRMKIQNIFVHPEYEENDDIPNNDVAILKLEVGADPKKFYHGPYSQLPHENFDVEDDGDIVTLGYGQAKELPSDEKPRYTVYPLHGASLNQVSWKQCIALLNQQNIAGETQLNNITMMCFWNINTVLCDGDYGGPLVASFKEKDIQIGIVSWGRNGECRRQVTPSIFTRLTRYTHWINQIINEYGCTNFDICQERNQEIVNISSPMNDFYEEVPIDEPLDVLDIQETCADARSLECDTNALRKFKGSVTQGENVLESWNGDNPCNWSFVECSIVEGANERVTKLNIQDTHPLSAKLVREFSQLRYIEEFIIQQLNITGTLPKEFSVLKRLQQFGVYRTTLSGELPPEFSTWTKIQYFSVSFNFLTGILPAQYSIWKNLRYIYLGENQFSGEIPKQFSKWKECNEFYAHDNKLKGSIPTQLSEMAKIQELDLNINEISGSLPSQFSNWKDSRKIQMRYNKISGRIPMEFSEMSKINVINLSHNEISGSLPSQFSFWKNCTEFRLNHNRLAGTIPVEYSEMAELSQLYLTKNFLGGTLPPQFSFWKNISGFLVNENRMFGNIPVQYSKMSQIYNMNLGQNKFNGSLYEYFSNWKNIQEIRLQLNNFQGTLPEQFSTMKNLGVFEIFNNNFSGKLPSQFSEWQNCTIFKPSSNYNIRGTLPKQFSVMKFMKWFWISYTEINGTLPKEYSTWMHLEEFSSIGNKIVGGIPKEWSSFNDQVIKHIPVFTAKNANQIIKQYKLQDMF